MPITEKMIDQAYSDFAHQCGGHPNDYFGLLYLTKEFKVSPDQAVNQVAFGGNDYGIDGFYFDQDRKNLYLFQFKNSNSYILFKDSLQRLNEAGMERIFISPQVDQYKNQMLVQLRSCMVENRAMIDQVCFRFVFMGDPAEAERSQVLDKLREDLENKKYMIDQFFQGRSVSLVVDFRSAAGKIGAFADERKTRIYKLESPDMLAMKGPQGQVMYIGLLKLSDLLAMYKEIGNRFFERNIRYGLGTSESVNRAISRALKQILIDGNESPEVFTFNHNGISLYAENIQKQDGHWIIHAPRLLNGAQTITTFYEFLDKNRDNPRLKERQGALANLQVLCKIITQAKPEFITEVTINNNRQNPIEPWNLHANDMLQLELQDKFRDDLGIYYERQENAFQNLSTEDMEEEGISEESKAIQLVKLAQTFLVSDGNISALSNMRRIFEDDNAYSQVFNNSRLMADSRYILLCYKVHFRLRRLLREIEEKGPNKYWYIYKARNLVWGLLCQGILNDKELNDRAEEYGKDMSMKAQYTDYLAWLTSARIRSLLADLVKDKAYADKVAEENFSFFVTNAAFKKSMEYAYKRWKWVEKKLK